MHSSPQSCNPNENAAHAERAVRGQVLTPGYLPPEVPTSLGTNPKGLGTWGGRYLWVGPGAVRRAGRARRVQCTVPLHTVSAWPQAVG